MRTRNIASACGSDERRPDLLATVNARAISRFYDCNSSHTRAPCASSSAHSSRDSNGTALLTLRRDFAFGKHYSLPCTFMDVVSAQPRRN